MLQNLDTYTFFFINQKLANPFFDVVMPWMTKLGDNYFVACFGILLFILGKKYAKLSALFILSSYAVAKTACSFLKSFFNSPRPFESLENIRLLASCSSGLSFPSGHTTLAFCLATVLAVRYPKIKYIAFIYALVIGFSRIYIGVHYPGDVVTGAALGALIGYIITKIANKYLKE